MGYSARPSAKTATGNYWRSWRHRPPTVCRKRPSFLASQLDAKSKQVNVNMCGARRFLDERLSVGELAGLFPEEEDLIEELGVASPG